MDASTWLTSRYPPPPPTLAEQLRTVLGTASQPVSPELLLAAAGEVFAGFLAGDPDARASAVHLLTADALVTYALELAADDPASLDHMAREALHRIASWPVHD